MKLAYTKSDLVVDVSQPKLTISLKGKVHEFDLENVSSILAKADEHQRKQFRISDSGYGINWDLLDEDISIPALLNEPDVVYEKAVK